MASRRSPALLGVEPRFSALLLRELAARKQEWDVWRVQRLPVDSALARMLLSGDGALRAATHNVRQQPYLQLPETFEAFEARFAAKQRTCSVASHDAWQSSVCNLVW